MGRGSRDGGSAGRMGRRLRARQFLWRSSAPRGADGFGCRSAPRSSVLFGEAVEASAHLFELAPQVLDLGGAVLRTARVRLGRRGAGAKGKMVSCCQSLT